MRSSTFSTSEPALVRSLLERVNAQVDKLCRERRLQSINLMEVCGTHTMAISGFGIRRAVDSRLRLLSGPGCPVCVTEQEEIDAAIGLADIPEVTLATFGDMLRVPGSNGSLEQARALGADVRVVYSPLDALAVAEVMPDRQIVFLGVGFETTAPTVAAAVLAARKRKLSNFTVLPMFKLIPPALAAIAALPRVNVDGLILPGHVSVMIGVKPYRFLADRYGKSCCIVGFEALDVVQGILMLLEQLAEDRPQVAIQYRRNVRENGNPKARQLMEKVFEPRDAAWRGIGVIPRSGLGFRAEFSRFDSEGRLGGKGQKGRKGHKRQDGQTACRCGEVMLGVIVPPECRLFGKACTPERPVGPCMVSSEGACAAYYRYEQ